MEMRSHWRILSREVCKVILVFKDSSSFFMRIYGGRPNSTKGAPSRGQTPDPMTKPASHPPPWSAHLPDRDMSPNPLHRTFQGSPQPPQLSSATSLHGHQGCTVSYYAFLSTVPSKPMGLPAVSLGTLPQADHPLTAPPSLSAPEKLFIHL